MSDRDNKSKSSHRGKKKVKLNSSGEGLGDESQKAVGGLVLCLTRISTALPHLQRSGTYGDPHRVAATQPRWSDRAWKVGLGSSRPGRFGPP